MTNTHLSLEPLSWAAVEACTLPTAERPLRAAEFDDLFVHTLQVDRIGPTVARLSLAGDSTLADHVRDLIERETACCSFFAFEVADLSGTVELKIMVPAAHADVLEALVERAERVRG